MFSGATHFNGDTGNWDVSNVRNMSTMFSGATSFNQPLGNWNVSNVTDMSGMFSGVTLSTANYDNLLIGWSSLTLYPNVWFDGGNSRYSDAGAAARQSIIDTYAWHITDGGH